MTRRPFNSLFTQGNMNRPFSEGWKRQGRRYLPNVKKNQFVCEEEHHQGQIKAELRRNMLRFAEVRSSNRICFYPFFINFSGSETFQDLE